MLFNIVELDVAVFGKKDYQQWRIIQGVVRDLDFGIRMIGSGIVREYDGLAMSSCNVKLLPEDCKEALSISYALPRAKLEAENGEVKCRELINLVSQTINEGGRVNYAAEERRKSWLGGEPVENTSSKAVLLEKQRSSEPSPVSRGANDVRIL